MATEILARKNQRLTSHLNNVSAKAETFGAAFSACEHAQLAGLLHDIGKAEEEFQIRVRSDDKEGRKIPHSPHGAAVALQEEAWPIAFAIAGHHSGLHNRGDLVARRDILERAKACLDHIRCGDRSFTLPAFPKIVPPWLEGLEFDPRHAGNGWFAADLFTRLLFSAVVDADRLDAEEAEKSIEQSRLGRKWRDFDAAGLFTRLNIEITRRAEAMLREGRASEIVVGVRQEVAERCRCEGKNDRGLFSLTVPTGGGKTLSSMLFALSHALGHRDVAHGKPFRRVIVVIPYLSIIRQTAKELKEIFGQDVVLEHHSQAGEGQNQKGREKESVDGNCDSTSVRRRLATENWDAPIIVTTSVQFFDSLFSRRPSAARKLHNICQSIIIFDEVQTLPPLLLQPILSVLGELANPARPYGCSIVFCTATQPALERSDEYLSCGLENVRPLIPPDRARELFRLLDRVRYEWPEPGEGITWNDLAKQVLSVQEPRQALVIVNTRKAARDLHGAFLESMGGRSEGLFHLSTWMTPAHRQEVLEEVRRRLDNNEKMAPAPPCILVSTQCIEAGVDVDFPQVWRAFGPYDAIVQAAGRCNRNGRQEKGTVRVFRPKDGETPPGLYSTAISQTELLCRMGKANPCDPNSFRDYFQLLYQLSVPDECIIQRARARFQFKEVDELFRFIEDDTFPVLIVRHMIGEKEQDSPAATVYVEAEKRGFFTREDWREMQPHIINLPRHNIANAEIDWKILPAFDKESGLYTWNGVYRGRLSGYGIDFEAEIPAERTIV